MNNNVKISVTIQGIPGGTRRLTGETETKQWYITKGDVCKNRLEPKERARVLRKGKYTSKVYEVVPCSQRINMTQEAYDYFVSDEKPYWFRSFADWKRKTPRDRIEIHLARVCESLNGTSFTYNVFDD